MVSDVTRNCFYALTAKNSILIYKTAGEKSIEHIQTISNLYKSAQEKAPGAPALTPQNFTIIGLHVVQPNESRLGIQLVAVTVNGIRLYFSPSSIQYNYYGTASAGSSSSLRPLNLVHVRLPPSSLLHPDEQPPQIAPYNAPQSPQVPQLRHYVVTMLDSSCYSEGVIVCAQPGDSDGFDYILCVSPDLTRIGALGQTGILPQNPHGYVQQQQPQQPPWPAPTSYGAPSSTHATLTEYATLLNITGRTWGIKAVPRPQIAVAPSGSPAPVITNELATQFSEPAKYFMILTTSGLIFLAKRRALDYLRAVIEELQSEGNVQPIIEFKEKYVCHHDAKITKFIVSSFGRDQTCAMLLGLASGNTFIDNDVHLGFEPGVAATSALSAEVASMAKQAFYDFGERPVWAERTFSGTGEHQYWNSFLHLYKSCLVAGTSGNAIFSGRREGLALYFARLVRPLWRAKLTKPACVMFLSRRRQPSYM